MKRLRVAAVLLVVGLGFALPTQAQVCRAAAGVCDVSESWATAPTNPGAALFTPTDGTLATGAGYWYNMGYGFTPNKTIVVTALGGFFSGTKTVYLYDRTTGAVLASATVTAANNWAYAAIAPVTLVGNSPYSVSVNLGGSGGAYRSLATQLPRTLADATINYSCYRYVNGGAAAEPCSSGGVNAAVNYGMADIKYLVSSPHYQPTEGTLYTDVPGDYIGGYAFTPNKNLTVTSLGGLWNGTKTVYLFNRTTGAVLASAVVTSANSWIYTPISPPVTLTAGQPYTVASYSPGGGGGAYRTGLTSMPSSRADATIDGSCYRPATNAEPCVWSGLLAGNNYGMTDFKYAPTGGGTYCPINSFLSSATTCRAAAGTCDVAEKCSGSSAACPADVFTVSSTCSGSSPNPIPLPIQNSSQSSSSSAMASLGANAEAEDLEAEDPEAPPPAAPLARSAPDWVTYLFFFSHLDALERAAEEDEARGDLQAAKEWRTHEQLAAGLDERQGALLKQVAAECLEAVEAKDEQIQKGLEAFREEHPNGAHLQAHLPPELKVLWQQRINFIERQIGRLQSLLGDDFHKLDSYIRANFVPVVVDLGQDAAEGGVQ